MMHDRKISIIRARRRTIALQVLPDSTILVKVPHLTLPWEVNRFIKLHEDWISRQMKKIENRPRISKKQYVDGEEFLYLGNPHMLTVGEYTAIEARNGRLLYPRSIHFRVRKELEAWYIGQAKKIISERVSANAAAMKVSYLGIMYSDTKSKWGSCRHDNYLQFNWRLIMAPMIVLNYVVVHELAHIVEKNHSRAFWRTVEAHNPSFRQQRKWLRDRGQSLVL